MGYNDTMEEMFNLLYQMSPEDREENIKNLPPDILAELAKYSINKAKKSSGKEEAYGVYDPDAPKVLRPYPTRNDRLRRAYSESLGAEGLEMQERLHNKMLSELEEDPIKPDSHK